MAKSLNESDNGSELDIINRIKAAVNVEEKFLKLLYFLKCGVVQVRSIV